MTYDIRKDGSFALVDLVRQIQGGSAARNVVSQTVSFYDGGAYAGLPFGQIGNYGALTLTQTLARCFRRQRATSISPAGRRI
jgi:hypothetical protein